MADFDFPWSVAHRSGGVFKEDLLLRGAHQAEELTRLGIVVGIVFVEIPVIGIPGQFQRRFGKLGLFLPLTIAVGFIAEGAAVVAVHSHGPVTVEAVVGAAWGVDGNLMVIYPQTVTLGIAVREEPTLEHLVG